MGDIASIYYHTDDPDPDRSVRSWLVTFLKHQPDPLKPKAGKYRYGIDEFGSPGGRAWVNKRGFLHRVDGPAVESDEGEKGWAREGWKIIRPFPSFPLAFMDSDLVPPESAGTSASITADGNDG